MVRWREFRDAVEVNDGVASRALARHLGIPDGTWRTWRRRHFVRRLHDGAWTLHDRPTSTMWLRAALDVLGPQAMLGGSSALWALRGADPDGTPLPLEVVLPHETSHRRVGPVRIRRSRTLLDDDRVEVGRWTSTSAARTALDLAARRQDAAARALCLDLVFERLVTPSDLLARADATPTAWGSARLRRVAGPLCRERSDSVFEWEVRRCLEDAGIALEPGPRTVATPDGAFELDVVVAGRRVAVECDGASHRTPSQQQRDARKGNALSLAGWTLLRTTWWQFRADPDVLVDQVRRGLAPGG